MEAIPAQCQAAVAATTQTWVETINTSAGIIFTIWFSFGLFVGDWSSCFAFEVRLLQERKATAILYFGARIFGFASVFTYVLTTLLGSPTSPSNSCLVNDKLLATFTLVANTFAQAIFMLRCLAVWNWNRVVKYLFAVLLLATVGGYAIYIHFITATQSQYGLLYCQLEQPSKWESIQFFITTLCDTIIIGLTVVKLRQNPRTSRVQQLLYRDGIIYYLLVVIISIATAALVLADLAPLLAVLTSPIHAAVVAITSTRAYRNLKMSQNDKFSRPLGIQTLQCAPELLPQYSGGEGEKSAATRPEFSTMNSTVQRPQKTIYVHGSPYADSTISAFKTNSQREDLKEYLATESSDCHRSPRSDHRSWSDEGGSSTRPSASLYTHDEA